MKSCREILNKNMQSHWKDPGKNFLPDLSIRNDYASLEQQGTDLNLSWTANKFNINTVSSSNKCIRAIVYTVVGVAILAAFYIPVLVCPFLSH